MKKATTLRSIPVLLLILLISACSKSDYSHTNSGTIQFTQSGGSSFTYLSKDGMLGSSVSGENAVNGFDQYNEDNKLVIYCPIASGTYQYDPVAYPTYITLYKGSTIYTSYTNTGTASPGSITVTTSGTRSTATFNVTLYNTLNASDQIVITTGSYAGKYASR